MAPGSHLLVLLPTAVVQLNPLWPLPHAPSQPVMLGDSRVVLVLSPSPSPSQADLCVPSALALAVRRCAAPVAVAV
ncbi:hypothetical protein ACJX0J_030166, partial [Zea mays]